jgi:hypothetical protein
VALYSDSYVNVISFFFSGYLSFSFLYFSTEKEREREERIGWVGFAGRVNDGSGISS